MSASVRIAFALIATVTAMNFAQAQTQTPTTGGGALPKLSAPLTPHPTVTRKPIFTGLGCSLDPANGDSYRLVNTNTYQIPAASGVTVYASKNGKIGDLHKTWTTSDPIKAGDYLRVGNYNPNLGLTTCWAVMPYIGP